MVAMTRRWRYGRGAGATWREGAKRPKIVVCRYAPFAYPRPKNAIPIDSWRVKPRTAWLSTAYGYRAVLDCFFPPPFSVM